MKQRLLATYPNISLLLSNRAPIVSGYKDPQKKVTHFPSSPTAWCHRMIKLQPGRSKKCLVTLSEGLKRERMSPSFLLPPSYCLDLVVTVLGRLWQWEGRVFRICPDLHVRKNPGCSLKSRPWRGWGGGQCGSRVTGQEAATGIQGQQDGSQGSCEEMVKVVIF